MDFETSVLDSGSPLNPKNRILCACWCVVHRGKSWNDSRNDKHIQWKSVIGGENDLEELLRDIASVDFIVAHNAKFELGWLKRCGLDLRSVLVFDTYLGEWVLLGNLRGTGLGLNESGIRRGCKTSKDVVGGWIRGGVDSENIPRQWLLYYCSQDVVLTRELFLKQVVLLQERKQLHLVYQRGLVCACLADIEFNGLKLDKSRVYEEHERVQKEYIGIRNELDAEFGAINWRSPKQVCELLYNGLGFDPEDDESPSAAKDAIANLKPRSKTQAKFLELYKKAAHLSARLTKSLNFFKGVCDEYDGVFHGVFNQGFTQTHRLSSSGRKLSFKDGTSSGAQFQNLPREYKRLFTSKRKGWLIGDCDSSGVEFRVAADLGDDQIAKKEIADGEDIHSHTVKAFAEAGEIISRQDAKPQTFKPLYAGRGHTDAEQAYCKFFQNKYEGIYKTQTEWVHQVVASKIGELITPYGMRFYWPGTKVNRYGWADNTTSIFNYSIQGFSTGEILPIAITFFWHRIKGHDIELVNTIHDSAISEIAPNEADYAKETYVQSFTRDVYNFLERCYGYSFKTQLGCEVKIGEHWGEGQGEKFSVDPGEGRHDSTSTS